MLAGVDVLTALADEAHGIEDAALLDRATQLGRPLFTMDLDLVKEGRRRQAAGIDSLA